MSRAYSAAAASQMLLLVYLEAVEWIDLFPWNDVRHGNGQAGLDIALGVIVAAGIASAWRRWRPGLAAAALIYAAWLALQVVSFWIPYVRGASPEWTRIYASNFAGTVQWLPRAGAHLPPDANHIVLQLVLVVALLATATAAWSGERIRS